MNNNIDLGQDAAMFDPEPHRGGDVKFIPGRAFPRPKDGDISSYDGRIILCLPDEQEFIRIESDGSFFVNGHKVTDDLQMYREFRNWLSGATFSFSKPLPQSS